MVHMKDIANRCQVSVATVSKALNGYSDIGEKKREEIKSVAREMGYVPNSSTRALRTNRSFDLGVLFSDKMNSGLTHDYFAAILDSFKVAAELNGYDITFTSMGMKANRRITYYEHCLYRGLDGVVIAHIDFTTPEVLELVRSSLPVVTIDFVFDGRIAILSDNSKGMRDLVNYVYQMGHRKIAYITGDENTVSHTRLSSFCRTLAEKGISIPDSYIRRSRFRDIDMTFTRTMELLSLADRPTCIFFPDDFAALGGINAIRKASLQIPDDISIVGFDGIPISRAVDPRLTTLSQDTKTIGQRAAEELISLIENPRTTSIGRILIEGKLVEGESVKRLD